MGVSRDRTDIWWWVNWSTDTEYEHKSKVVGDHGLNPDDGVLSTHTFCKEVLPENPNVLQDIVSCCESSR